MPPAWLSIAKIQFRTCGLTLQNAYFYCLHRYKPTICNVTLVCNLFLSLKLSLFWKTTSCVHPFATSLVLTPFSRLVLCTYDNLFQATRTCLRFLAILWCLWWLCVPYLWYSFHMEVCGFIQMILYQRYAYSACICMYHPIWFYMDVILHGFYMDFIYHGQ